MVTTVSSSSPSKPTIHPPPPTLTEDDIDDLLYFCRAGELDDFKTTVSELSKSLNRYTLEIPAAAADQYSGNTCLHMAAANDHTDIVEYILSLEQPPLSTPVVHPEVSAGGNSSGILPETMTAESLTSISIQQPYIHALLNFPNSSGNTPLHWACLNGHIASVKLLVKAGADPGVLNMAGHDCVYEAEANDKSNVVEWVLNFAEGLESGVGVVGEEGDGEEKGKEEEEQDNADVLRNEGSRHEGKEVEGKEGESSIAIEKLDLEEKEPTIR
ncbi:Espin [Dactylellina cionopaga]|nr:Espin [Dactylellina cionopaga]